MNFKQKYTTNLLVENELSVLEVQDPKKPILNGQNLEKDKIVLSNDAYAIGELLECLINTMGRK